MSLRKRIAAAVLVMVAVNYAQQHGWTLPSFVPGVAEPVPVKTDGFYCLIARNASEDSPTAGQMAVIGSQLIEDACEGGDYEVYWEDETPPDYCSEVVSQLRNDGTPSWCLSDSSTGRSLVGPVPETVDAALAEIRRVRGVKP